MRGWFRRWTRRFQADPSVLGRTVWFLESPYTVVGVAQKGFIGVEAETEVDAWAPISARSIHVVSAARPMPIAKNGMSGTTSLHLIRPRFHQMRTRMTAGSEQATVLLSIAPRNNSSDVA